jgi:hypothetical protein
MLITVIKSATSSCLDDPASAAALRIADGGSLGELIYRYRPIGARVVGCER